LPIAALPKVLIVERLRNVLMLVPRLWFNGGWTKV